MSSPQRLMSVAAGLCAALLHLNSPSWVAAQGEPPKPEEMFRQLDANQDGKLTLNEGGPGSQQFIRRLFDMAKKPASGSISREEFLRIAEQHRNGGGGQGGPGRPPGGNNGPPGPPPTGEGRLASGPGDRGVRFSRADLSRIMERFDALDTNRDGALDGPELAAAHRDMAEGDVAPPGATRATSAESEKGSGDPGNSRTGTGKSGSSARSSGSSSPSSALKQGTARRGAAGGTRTGRERLAGIWRGWLVNGRGEDPTTGQMEMELTITANRIVAKELGTNRAAAHGELGEGTFVMVGSGTSGNLDATSTSGQHQGREYLGVYEIDGDTLKWCVDNRGRRTRPQEFETGRGNYLMVLRRQAN